MFKFPVRLATDKRRPDTDNQNSFSRESVGVESGLSKHFRLRGNWKLQAATATAPRS